MIDTMQNAECRIKMQKQIQECRIEDTGRGDSRIARYATVIKQRSIHESTLR